MKFYVTASWTGFDEKAHGYVQTERLAELEAAEGETVRDFADRAHDILLSPHPGFDPVMTPRQFRLCTMRGLFRKGNGYLLPEDRPIADFYWPTNPSLELKPRTLSGG